MTKRVVLIGDSITQGLGSKKINFTGELQSLLGDEFYVDNMALTGTTIEYAKTIVQAILDKKPDAVVIIYGSVDAQIRPNRKGYVFSHIPGRFQKSGMLMPRPFYSHSWYKKIGQKIDNGMRWIFSKLIYCIDGTEQWVDLEVFKEIYREVVLAFLEEKIKVVICSTVFIDEKKFHGSLMQYKYFNEELQKMAQEFQVKYVDLFSLLEKAVQTDGGWKKFYCDDHFHPNAGGYKIIARTLSNELSDGEK